MPDAAGHDLEITAQDLRPGAGRVLTAPARRERAWDWDSDEPAPDMVAELDELRVRVQRLEGEVERARDAERHVLATLSRLAKCGWLERRRVVAELRDCGLVED